MILPMNHHCPSPAPDNCTPQPACVFYPVPIYVLVQCPPPTPECHEEKCGCECECECDELAVPQQIDANGDMKPTALVGGLADAQLTLEYLVETGATDTTVTVAAVQPDGTSSTRKDSGAAVGFHIQEKFLAVKPGTKLTLEVADIKVTARLRWCETISS